MTKYNQLQRTFEDIFDSINTNRMELSPSEWAEKYRKLTSEVSTLTGPFRYNITPYLREIVDTLSPYHPAKIVAVIKGSQIGYTEGVIVNGILWMIANNPGNCLALSANDELSREMVEGRLDQGIMSCGIQDLIRPNTIRKRNQRTGDTSKSKEYAGGRLYAGSLKAVDKFANQRSVRYGFFDDWDTAEIADKKEGSTFDLLQNRFKTAAKSMKQYYISTPRTKPSNIENLYLRGDQRKWKVPCPKCGAYIEILWYKVKDGEVYGVYFEKDKNDKLVRDSVGYICQECGEFFKERYKYDINLQGRWVPTAEPSQIGFQSYHITSLVSAPHTFTWTDYAEQWLQIYEGDTVRKAKLKVFTNQVLGQAWEERKETINAKVLSQNTRNYSVGTVPNKISLDDGNGAIIILTCACDLNGTVDDARLDYDVWGHSENGTIYSIDQGSIGTFQPGKKPDDRDLWSYKNEAPNNVWDYFWNEIINRDYHTDDDGIRRILSTGIDTGYMTHFAYGFIDQFPYQLMGLKGKADDQFLKYSKDVSIYKPATERPNLFLLESNLIKDELAEMIQKKWTEGNPQPAGFMNFPMPTREKYTKNYFVQYEAETRVLEENIDGDPIAYKWVKKSHSMPNHFFDCAYYNLAVRNILVDKILKESKLPKGTWTDFVNILKNIG